MVKVTLYMFLSLAFLSRSLSAAEPHKKINDLSQSSELSFENIDKKQPQSELFKLLAELDHAQVPQGNLHAKNHCKLHPLGLQYPSNLEESEPKAHTGLNAYTLLPSSFKHQSEHKVASACSTAFSLYQLVGNNCIQAAYKLYKSLNEASSHTYLRSVLKYHFTKSQGSPQSYAHIPDELIRNTQFCLDLKQSLSSKGLTSSQESVLPALKDLHKQLHYYTWLKALNQSQKSFSTSRFFTEDFKGLSENLRLIIWSMINDMER